MTLSTKPIAPVKANSHLGGVDLLRGIAMFAVVILHADEGLTNLPPTWQFITKVASFAVPFFLATSFYFAAQSLYAKKGRFLWQKRLSRLLLPYILWSGIYLAYRSLKYLVTQQPERIIPQFQDPLSLIFFGSATLHLYFLPLLATGTLLMGLLASRLIRLRPFSLSFIGLIIASWLGYEILIKSGNNFQHASNLAFQSLLTNSSMADNPLIRLLSVGIAWGLRCLPYILLALIVAKIPIPIRKHPIYQPSVIVGGISVICCGHLLLPPALNELLCGYGALLIALEISSLFSGNLTIRYLGECAFGIYLLHLLFVETFQSLIIRIYPPLINETSTTALISAAMVIFLISWMSVFFLRQKTALTKLKVV